MEYIPTKPLVREAFEYVRNKLGIVLLNYLVREQFEHVRNKLGIVLVNYCHLFDFKIRAYEIECNINVGEYTFHSAISMWESIQYLRGRKQYKEEIKRVTRRISLCQYFEVVKKHNKGPSSNSN